MSVKAKRVSRRSFLKIVGKTLAAGVGSTLAPHWVASAVSARTSPVHSTARFQQKAVDLAFWVIPYWKGKTGKEADGKESDYYDWQIEEFKKKFPNVTIKPTFIPSTFEGWAKFDAAVASGNAPDVMWGQAGNQWKYAPQEAVEAFDDWIDPALKAEMLTPIKNLCGYVDGKIYLWPYGLAVAGGVFANRSLFDKFKATDLLPKDKERSWTTAQYEKALAATTGTLDGQKIYGTAYMTDWSYQMTQFLYGFGADVYNEFQTKMVMNSPEGAKALQWLVDTENKNNWSVPTTPGRTQETCMRLFMEQKFAILPSQPYYITAFRNQPDLKPGFDWVFCQPPHEEGKQAAAEANAHGYLVSKQSDKDKLAVCMEFVKHLTRPEALEIASNGQGLVPPTKTATKILEGDTERYVEGVLGANAKPWGRLYGELGPKVLTPLWDSAFGKTKTVQQALDDAVAAGNKIIDETAKTLGWPTK
jgi:ABC-type glycerol-3-phosphate transport system substrate-binding protein